MHPRVHRAIVTRNKPALSSMGRHGAAKSAKTRRRKAIEADILKSAEETRKRAEFEELHASTNEDKYPIS